MLIRYNVAALSNPITTAGKPLHGSLVWESLRQSIIINISLGERVHTLFTVESVGHNLHTILLMKKVEDEMEATCINKWEGVYGYDTNTVLTTVGSRASAIIHMDSASYLH